MAIPKYMAYWGKAKKTPEQTGPNYHPLAFHNLDVAAVAWFLLDPKLPLCQSLAKQLAVKADWLRNFFVACLAMHDIGKFCRAFQSLVPNLSPNLVTTDSTYIYDKRHDTLGYSLWRNVLASHLADVLPIEYKPLMLSWLEIVCGHHGSPPESLQRIDRYFDNEDKIAAEYFVRDIIQGWFPDLTPLLSIDKKRMRKTSWQLAGVAVLADWLGSNQEIFKYYTGNLSLKEYWRNVALKNAQLTVENTQLFTRRVTEFSSIKQQFDFINEPTPLQKFSENIQITDEPQLFILEDVTGAGKTEAAMALVHKLMSVGAAYGVYIGLPTMATANAMYQRMAKTYSKLYQDEDCPSLVLAHGASKLSKQFNASISLSNQPNDVNYQVGELSASAYCNVWLADSRKKALLADIGVGTIDQALLGVLPAKHQSLRLLGLLNKVLLVDEVHAYDPYMQSLLKTLIHAHAAQGGSTILLSATLPKKFRMMLTNAHKQGASFEHTTCQSEGKNPYPLVTHVTRKKVQETHIETRECVARTVAVKRINNETQATQIIKRAVEQGQCVCWVRNTVKDACQSYQRLMRDPTIPQASLRLFHSRFAMVDRQKIEQSVLDSFGAESTHSMRKGQILIATQVVEQSLDLDFDVMISDLAPIDLMIQRAGRLQRHLRFADGNIGAEKDERPKPCLYVVSPDPEKVENNNWLNDVLPGSQAVYQHTGQLWLTITALIENGGFSMPEDARHLIEKVYGDNDYPPQLDDNSNKALAEQKSHRGMGNFNCLNLDKGYTLKSHGQNGGWDHDVNIPTRLSNDSVTVALTHKVDGVLQPYAQAQEHAWEMSQLNIPKRDWQHASKEIPQTLCAEIEKLKETQPNLKWIELLPLVGSLTSLYSSDDGFVVKSE